MKIRTDLAAQPKGDVATQSKEIISRPGVERVIALIDTSYSMDQEFFSTAGPITRIKGVINALHYIVDISSRAHSEYGLIAFSTSSELLSPVTTRFTAVKAAAMRLSPNGGTHYAPALTAALSQKPDRAILLSDGEAGDKQEAIKVVQRYVEAGIKIDTVGIGQQGLDFLKRIAEMTGGVFMSAENVQQLQETFAKLETRARLQLEHRA